MAQPELFNLSPSSDEADIKWAHNNQHLFSDHFLEELLRNEPGWESIWQEATVEASNFLEWLTDLYTQNKSYLVKEQEESDLERYWFEEIFRKLGHAYEKQVPIPDIDKGYRYPDYIFFPDVATRQAAAMTKKTPAYVNNASAVGEVKKWGIDLDRKLKSGKVSFHNNNPMFQMFRYLQLTELDWGILSNGEKWRLIHRDSSDRLNTYFELDLEKAIKERESNPTRAKATVALFLIFFRKSSFQPDKNGRILVNDALKDSVRYSRELEKDLQINAYRALEYIIQGFMKPQGNKFTADDLPRIYTNSLYLMYRIIFLLYGEDRGLMPMHLTAYKRESLTQIAEGIATHESDWSPMNRKIYDALERLFTLINGDQPDLNQWMHVPRYNGGLFSPVQHPFLKQYFVGDAYLARAINILTHRKVTEPGRTGIGWEKVDYRTLSVRQIGSVYEGLLEYKPRRATQQMVVVSQGQTEKWVPVSEKPTNVSVTGNPIRDPGDIYLVTDKGERKATGSYYTPDYIVKYIVENTLGPMVEQAAERAEQRGKSFVDELLQTRVLDPAMGSGHFLVAATDFLARKLIEYGNDTDEAGRNGETELTYWKRRVVERCIYGVDKNRMAVELAKLSLWLETVAADKPLSFLDHHLRHGDSLVGARIADLKSWPGTDQQQADAAQRPLFDETAFTRSVGLAVGGMATIARTMSDEIDAIHAKERMLREVREAHLARWRQLADVWTSYYFGNAMTREDYRAVANRLQGTTAALGTETVEPFLNHERVRENDFFHWELEFPEVFFDDHGRPLGEAAGFDAVIGNPPYVRQEQISINKAFWQTQFNVFHNAADLYIYFLELATMLLSQGGITGVIVSHKFMRAEYGFAARHFLTHNTTLEQIVHLGDLPIFGEVAAYPAILQWRKNEAPPVSQEVQVAQFVEMGFENNLSTAVNETAYIVSEIGLKDSGWTLRNGQITNLQRKIKAAGILLSEYVQDKIHYGLKTGLNEAFFISEEQAQQILQKSPTSEIFIKPLLKGEDIGRYSLNTKPQFVIVIPAGWTKNHSGLTDEDTAWSWLKKKHPGLTHWLAPFANQARQRQDKGDFWWELRPCAYYDAFEQPKIIYPVIAKDLRFALDTDGFYSNDKTFILPVSDFYLLALLNASMTHFFARFALSGLRGDYLEFRTAHFQQAPIFKIQFNTPIEDRTAVLDTAQAHYEADDTAAVQALAVAELAADRTDTVHDILAYLAQQMIRLNKERQAQVSAFWLDLEGVTDPADFDKLRHKGKWEQSLHKHVSAARPFVDGDSRSTVNLDESLGWNNDDAFKGFVRQVAGRVRHLKDMLDVYGSYAQEVARINGRLADTDRLIDQIVYRLYGLTDDEIAIVEGA